MIKENITLDDTIDFLNSLVEIDRPAIAALIANRVPCNEKLANHETVQAGKQNGGYHVGMLGILNGLFGVDERNYGPIAFEFDDKGGLKKVVRWHGTRKKAPPPPSPGTPPPSSPMP